MGLASAQRLKRRRDFDAVFQRGRKLVQRRLILWMLPREDAELSRVGLSVGRRVGNSPARTRVKRLLREAWRARAGQLPAACDAVLLARPGQAPADLREALAALDDLLQRAARPPSAEDGRRRGGRRGARRGGAPKPASTSPGAASPDAAAPAGPTPDATSPPTGTSREPAP